MALPPDADWLRRESPTAACKARPAQAARHLLADDHEDAGAQIVEHRQKDQPGHGHHRQIGQRVQAAAGHHPVVHLDHVERHDQVEDVDEQPDEGGITDAAGAMTQRSAEEVRRLFRLALRWTTADRLRSGIGRRWLTPDHGAAASVTGTDAGSRSAGRGRGAARRPRRRESGRRMRARRRSQISGLCSISTRRSTRLSALPARKCRPSTRLRTFSAMPPMSLQMTGGHAGRLPG